ncbi:hypothetical protein [Priestia megaterium]|uniref:ATP-binding protein n=1 Tax=Priestia megaterium TaxID=1404 RepID=A0A6M6E0D9_PRIMG|nr:hypothetical protein [Priestia megaterium]QJX77055.1 hypothetical protein FDZ14_12905 [Priestia megaterium]
MIRTNDTFKTSVNIKFDLGKKEFINRYLPTPSHAESLIGLLKGFTNSTNSKAHMIVGPYGTGKSLIATIVGGIVSKQVDRETFKSLQSKFNKVHDEIYEELNNVTDNPTTYLTVALNGNEGRFRHAILNAIIRTLNENEIDIVLPGQNGKIIQVVELWEEKFNKTFKAFKRLLAENDKDFKLWRLAILNQEKEEIDWFISIYPELTAGAEFFVDYQTDFISQIKFVLDELKKKNLGLFIAYDEFGRMLQTLELIQVHETMQDLQDLAELTDHYEDNLHLLLITHRNLSQYFRVFQEEFRNEFQRIEKRFKSYYVESDSFTFIRIADAYLKGASPENIHLNDVVNQLRKYPLFPELNQQELEKLVIEGVYPIHPVTLFLLPQLSSAFGQNERTLFTFLESNETGGLKNHLKKTEDYYLPSDLFSYFFPSIHDIDVSGDGLESLKIYKKLISKTPELDKDEIKSSILKMITLWELSGLHARFKLDTDFLMFALNIKKEILIDSLNQLVALKAVRYNRVLGYWELQEGSSFFIDELILSRMPNLNNSKNKQVKALENCLTKRFYLANEYNDVKSMTRYAEVQFVFEQDILDENIDFIGNRTSNKADATLYYVILESSHHYNELVSKIKEIKDDMSIFCISKYSFDIVKEAVIELQVIDDLLKDAELLNQDKNLKGELTLKREDVVYIIQEFISKYTAYNNDCDWIYNQKEIDVANEINLEKLLSDIMFLKYPLTLEVRNDSFNRKTVNNMQRKAGYKVLDHILNSYDQNDLGIEGQGPDYLIYATIFKNNYFDLNNLDSLQSVELASLREDLLNYLENNIQGNLQQFIEVMTNDPYGLREPLIPIILVALLRDKWDQLMFYRNDMYVAGIDGETLYKMFEEATEYQYVYYRFSEEYDNFFMHLESQFSSYQNELVSKKPRVIRLSSGMLTWLRSLPRITQISNNMSEEQRTFKELIRKSEINPQDTLKKLFALYKEDIEFVTRNKKSLEIHFPMYLNSIEKEVNKVIKVESFEDARNWAMQQEPAIQKRNSLVKSLLRTSGAKKPIEEFISTFSGVEIENWSDRTSEVFKQQLANEYKSVSKSSGIDEKSIEIKYNNKVKSITNVELSTKSQTIYNNINRMIRNAGRNVPREEVEYLVYKLLEEIIE